MTLSTDEYQQALANQPAHMPQSVREKNARLSMILKPLPKCLYTAHSQIKGFAERMNRLSSDYGNPIEMNPDFQRGHVWTLTQKQDFVRNVLRGAIPESGFVIQFNCPNWENFDYVGDLPRGLQCVDGLQRVTALTEFCDSKFSVDGLFEQDLQGSSFAITRGQFYFIVQVYAFENKRELLGHYLAINGGGTPHSEDELDRVRQMMKESE